MSNRNHGFHLVNYSPWPFFGGIGGLLFFIRLVSLFTLNFSFLLIKLSILLILLTIFQWWRDISREGSFQGIHSFKVRTGLINGIILFIVSEVIFFVSFFWGYFHSRLSPTIDLGLVWPPVGVERFDPLKIPLLNTLILLRSGVTITWAHHRLLRINYISIKRRLIVTILLGFYFSILQILEYFEAPFSVRDSVYGRRFFVTTGFHGIHVLVGTIFLIISYFRHLNNHFRRSHHFGFEAAAWYWHFVDIIWLILYVCLYWWGG